MSGTQKMRLAQWGAVLAVTGLVGMHHAAASEIIYHPVNPNFGGNPLNGSFLLSEAQAQNIFAGRSSSTASASGASTAANNQINTFVRDLQSRLLSALSQQVTDAIFGANPKNSGTIVFGTQTISFVRGLENIVITISDSATGQTTQVQVPTLQVQ